MSALMIAVFINNKKFVNKKFAQLLQAVLDYRLKSEEVHSCDQFLLLIEVNIFVTPFIW